MKTIVAAAEPPVPAQSPWPLNTAGTTGSAAAGYLWWNTAGAQPAGYWSSLDIDTGAVFWQWRR